MNEKEKVKVQFGRNKDAYITSTTHGNEQDLQQLMKHLPLHHQMIALDIATGGGHVAKYLSKHVKHVVATDLTEEMLWNTANHLKEFKNIEFKVADAEQLPFPDNTFDIITCRYAAHHFPHPEKFIQEVYRTLKREATFLFVDNVGHENPKLDDFINRLDKMRDASHVRSLKISEWINMMNDSQFTILHEQTRNKKLPFTEWVTRTLHDQEDIERVKNFILQAKPEIQKHYNVTFKNHEIESFTLDEVVLVLQK